MIPFYLRRSGAAGTSAGTTATFSLLPRSNLRVRRPKVAPLRENRLPWIHNVRVSKDVDEGGPAGGEGALEGGFEVGGLLDQLRVAAKGFGDLVVAGRWSQLGGHRVAVE